MEACRATPVPRAPRFRGSHEGAVHLLLRIETRLELRVPQECSPASGRKRPAELLPNLGDHQILPMPPRPRAAEKVFGKIQAIYKGKYAPITSQGLATAREKPPAQKQ